MYRKLMGKSDGLFNVMTLTKQSSNLISSIHFKRLLIKLLTNALDTSRVTHGNKTDRLRIPLEKYHLLRTFLLVFIQFKRLLIKLLTNALDTSRVTHGNKTDRLRIPLEKYHLLRTFLLVFIQVWTSQNRLAVSLLQKMFRLILMSTSIFADVGVGLSAYKRDICTFLTSMIKGFPLKLRFLHVLPGKTFYRYHTLYRYERGQWKISGSYHKEFILKQSALSNQSALSI
ncbi:hypothetical protein BCR42DRAFT_490962 [Absidia repens]|uniref:Uncharacterized protein n=1 Tax=Absidia repens TaxID=90262 RepID=A0A1X2IJQ4_9FUNG|nr:hypothetical protein BCR42DRAFT_490962 [Absidia repens]